MHLPPAWLLVHNWDRTPEDRRPYRYDHSGRRTLRWRVSVISEWDPELPTPTRWGGA